MDTAQRSNVQLDVQKKRERQYDRNNTGKDNDREFSNYASIIQTLYCFLYKNVYNNPSWGS